MVSEFIQSLVALLLSALSQADKREQFINEFQQRVWNAPDDLPKSSEFEILSDLAYDLDFYEPNPAVRGEDPSYYDDERLEREIKSALQKLKISTDPFLEC